jgi:carbamoyl-phosphate synthase small subunit
MDNLRAVLALEDGKLFEGTPFGALTERCEGEVVFATTMTGYQEICTDPSYHGQIVVLTYPQVGNYGITSCAEESRQPWVAALIVSEVCEDYSHRQALESLPAYLKRFNIPGLAGIDTRALTRHLRTHGTKHGILRLYEAGHQPPDPELLSAARQVQPLSARDLVSDVAVSRATFRTSGHSPRVVIVDTGTKENIIRSLAARGLDVVLVPPSITLENIHALRPNGIVFPNGPGDPAVVRSAIALCRLLLCQGLPLMGICLGHQILALAAGARISRLPFGHHGANHPVRDLDSGQVTMTTQNHNFQVDAASVPPGSGFRVSHLNLLDNSVEGLTHEHLPIFSLQFHPEASPGPEENDHYFDRFAALVCEAAAVSAHRLCS